jgi:hypothetical protein
MPAVALTCPPREWRRRLGARTVRIRSATVMVCCPCTSALEVASRMATVDTRAILTK